jgi:hypothetical protein
VESWLRALLGITFTLMGIGGIGGARGWSVWGKWPHGRSPYPVPQQIVGGVLTIVGVATLIDLVL